MTMTPEEKAVIQAAIEWARPLGASGQDRFLTAKLADQTQRLIFSCDACNHARHQCPGCGTDVGHGDTACAACSDIPRDPALGRDCICSRDRKEYCASQTCHGGDDVPPESASTVATREMREALDAAKAPSWIPAVMRDLRVGDRVRPAGTAHEGSIVTDRYLPPGGDNARSWHVVPGPGGHWSDHVVREGEVWLCFDGAAPRHVDPAFRVEILMPAAEAAAIKTMGNWEDRLDGQLTSE